VADGDPWVVNQILAVVAEEVAVVIDQAEVVVVVMEAAEIMVIDLHHMEVVTVVI
jgi:hypothetical protein